MRRKGLLIAAAGGLVALPAASASAMTTAGAMTTANPVTTAGAPSPVAAGHAVPTTEALIPAHPGELLPTRGGTVDSLNWSGYAVTPGAGITAVSSTFTVPSVVSPVPPGFAATWTGIGGYNTSDLIQAGVGENSTPSNPLLGPQYYAWYEILPASETPLTNCSGDPNCTVNPGDQVTVNITNAGGNTWTVALSDAGHWTWSQNVSYASSESSAEWILEAPTVGAQTILANTGTTKFGPTSTYTQNGVTHTIAQGNPTTIDLSPSPVGGLNEATPSALASDGQSFNDCAYAQTCPTP
jgi:hypothetical protein